MLRTRFNPRFPLGRAPRRWCLCFLAVVVMARADVAETRPQRLRTEDTALLDEIERRAVLYFTEQSDAVTGFVLDRAPVDGTSGRAPSSVAATGFGLTALGIGEARGWISRDEARQRVRETLRFVLERHEQERGWYFHFVDAATGRRMWNCEASTIDTALLLQGALFAREHFRDEAISSLVQRIYARIDWRWALNGGSTVSHGWKPETGFIPHRWDRYAEMLGLYLLGLGAPVDALPPHTWHAWRREPWVTVGGRTYLEGGPLFTHQYAHAWFDFRDRRDAYADYWRNSVDATLAQRAWSAAQRSRFPLWSEKLWGLTASDSAQGYLAWGTPAQADADRSDGTVVPCAPGGSLPFAPAECLAALHRMREVGGDRVWGRYGFVDAFNPHNGWQSPDVIGINLGIMLVMAENLRTGLVWKAFMRAPEVQRGLRLAGFTRAAPAEAVPVIATVAP